MPDLPDELRAMLGARALDAPVPAAPPDGVVRRVRRRQAVRVTAFATGSLAAVALAVAAGSSALRPAGHALDPAAPGVPPATTPAGGVPGRTGGLWTLGPSDTVVGSPGPSGYDVCTSDPMRVLDVTAREDLRFGRGCYVVRAGTAAVRFANPTGGYHTLDVVADRGGDPVYEAPLLPPGSEPHEGRIPGGLAAGEYDLVCKLHVSVGMTARLVVLG